MLMKNLFPIVLGAAALAFLPTESPACTRAVYLGPEGMTVTGRTMDWREDPLTNLYIFPRGTARRGANTDNTVFWTSKYGTLSAAGYDIGITDGMNEAGLVANLLFLPESVYERPGDTRPVMGLSIWTQYVLDNFATVDEAVAGEEVGIGPDPVIRDGITHEDHFDGFTRQGGILLFVTPVLRPVAGLLGKEGKRRENRQRQEYDFFHKAIRFLGFSLTKLGNPERSAVRIHEEIVHIRAKHKIFRFLPPPTAGTEAPEGISRGQRYEICLFSCPKWQWLVCFYEKICINLHNEVTKRV